MTDRRQTVASVAIVGVANVLSDAAYRRVGLTLPGSFPRRF